MRWMWLGVLTVGCAGQVGDGDGIVDDDEVPDIGWVATINGTQHDLAGEAIIVDASTIEVRGFTYDGGGLNLRAFLLADGERFHRDYELTDNLVGDAYDDELLTLRIPDNADFTVWNLLTFWCIPAGISFGDGVFREPEQAQ